LKIRGNQNRHSVSYGVRNIHRDPTLFLLAATFGSRLNGMERVE